MSEEVLNQLNGFSFVFHWLRNWLSIVNQSQRVVKQNQSNVTIISHPLKEEPTLLAEHFFLASLLACTKTFASLIFCVVLRPREIIHKPTMRSTRDTNGFVHGKRLVIEKCSASRVGGPQARKGAL